MKTRYLKLALLNIFILCAEMVFCQDTENYKVSETSKHVDLIRSFKGNIPTDSLAVYINDLAINISKSEYSLKDAYLIQEAFGQLIHNYPIYEELSFLNDLIGIYIDGNRRDTLNYLKRIKTTRKHLLEHNKIGTLIRFNVELAHYQYACGNIKDGVISYKLVEDLIAKEGFNNLDGVGKLYATVNANSYGLSLMGQKNLDTAEYFFNLALQRAVDIKSEVWQGIISGNLSVVYLKKGKRGEAANLLKKDYQNSRKNKEVGSTINALFSLSDLEIDNGNLNLAKAYLDTAYIELQKVGKDDITFRTDFDFKMNFRLGKIAQAKGTHQEALKHFNAFYQTITADHDKLHDQLTKLNSERYLIEDRAYKISDLEQESERNLFLLGIFSLLIMLAVAMVFLQRRYNKTLADKNVHIEKQSKKLEAMNQQKSKLFSVVAHDVRGPIGTLSKLLELYQEKDITEEELIQYTQRISDNLSSLNAMLNNLLNWARTGMENGIEPKITSVDVIKLLNEILEQLAAQLSSKKLTLDFKHPERVLVQTDPAFLAVIIRNLLSNAIKFTEPETKISVLLTLDTFNNKLSVAISDKGKGISEETINEILNSSTGVLSKPGTKGELGTGLGLMLCKEFTNALNGKLDATSKLGEGTTFRVTLPIS